jgi:hypothetical protein
MREGRTLGCSVFYVEESFRHKADYLNAREPSLHRLFYKEKNNAKRA